MAEEHDLRTREQADREDVAALAADRARLSEVAVELDRCEQRVRELPGSRRYVFAARLEAPDRFVLLSEWRRTTLWPRITAPSSSLATGSS